MFKTIEHNTNEVEHNVRVHVAEQVCVRFPRIEHYYVERCFDRYPQAAFCYNKNKLAGLFFYNFFSYSNEGYFYFGPLFFFTRGAFALSASKVVRQFLKQYARVYFLAEVQNPELIIHLQTVLKPHINPKPFTFAISDHAKDTVQKFQAHIPQLDAINLSTFSSQGSCTLFYRNRKANLMTMWLARHGIRLDDRQALVLLIDLTYRKFLATNLHILFRYLTYPSHKISYLKTVEFLMRENHETQISAPAHHTEN